MLPTHTEYHDPGLLSYELHFKERTINRLKRKAADFGFLLAPIETTPV